ncbi:MAG: BamA/TamA family outer membrane protein, partial [Muribaculaceae bacterium]|nr:BamA/TamA family outer membrane protein [Muribaculaceae bacterium]
MKALSSKYISALILLAAVCGLVSCSTTRRIPSDEQLYTGVKKTDISNFNGEKLPEGVRDNLSAAVAVKPNGMRVLGMFDLPIPLGLWVYNNWPNPDKGLKHKIYNMLAQDPVLISDVRPELRTRMLDNILENNGYFRATTSYQLNTGKNPKRASVTYFVNPGPAYTLDTIEFLPDTTRLSHLIDSIARRDSYLVPGQRYCADSLSAVRTRITNALRNRGYYFFNPNYIEYLADSLMHPGHIALRLILASNAPAFTTRSYRVGNVTTTVYRNSGGGTPDTIQTQAGTLIQMMPSRLRHKTIPECVTFRSGRTFSVRDMNRTQTYLSRLGIFSDVTINVTPDSTNRSSGLLNVNIDCTIDRPLEATVEMNVSSKSNDYVGPGMTIGLTNRNIFGGGEQLNVSLKGAYEWQTGRNANSLFNSYEIGLSGTLSFPRMLMPGFVRHRRKNLNWTRITLNAELLNRPHYFKMEQFGGSFSYDWQSSRYSTSTFSPLKLTYTKLLHTTHDFDSIMDANEAVAQSFKSQFIPQIQYTYNYMRNLDRDNNINWTFSVQEAGNICWTLWRMAGVKGEKKLVGMPFSQFVKVSSQLVYGHRLGHADCWLVSRVALGAAHAYGNSSQVPYSEQFWVGGANSIRAFTVRSIGPGSYHDYTARANNYFDQTGTFKFEANVEYRFPIYGPLN